MATQDQKNAPETPAEKGLPSSSGVADGASSPNAAPRHSRVDRPAAASTSRTPVDDTAGGTTSIADGVVAKVAGIAAREVPGVYALGGGGARAFGVIRDAISASDLSQGVKVEVGETQAAADLTIVVEYPTPIQDVANNVRAAVAGAITRLVGLEVVEVNVDVDDVHVPGDDDRDAQESRVS